MKFCWSFLLFLTYLIPSVISNDLDRGQILPPGRYKIIIWTRRADPGSIDPWYVDWCRDSVFTTRPSDSRVPVLTRQALQYQETQLGHCLEGYGRTETDEEGQFAVDSLYFKDDEMEPDFCETLHRLNIHIFPLDKEFNPLLLSEDGQSPEQPIQMVRQKVDNNKYGKLFSLQGFKNAFNNGLAFLTNTKDGNNAAQCPLFYYHEKRAEWEQIVQKMLENWQKGGKHVTPEDLFMMPAYLRYLAGKIAQDQPTPMIDYDDELPCGMSAICTTATRNNAISDEFAASSDRVADLQLLHVFRAGLQRALRAGKLRARSQLAMQVLEPLRRLCNMDRTKMLRDYHAELDDQWGDICMHVRQMQADLQGPQLLGMLQRWLDGERWMDDSRDMPQLLRQTVANFVNRAKNPEATIDHKTLALFDQIGFIVDQALAKLRGSNFSDDSKNPVEKEKIEKNLPNFSLIGRPLAQFCTVKDGLSEKIREKKVIKFSGWNKFCEEFWTDSWFNWFRSQFLISGKEKIFKEFSDDKTEINYMMKMDVRLLIGGLKNVLQQLIDPMKNDDSSLIKILGNIFDRVIEFDIIMAMEVLYRNAISDWIHQICNAFNEKGKSRNYSSWRTICGVISWDKWLFLDSAKSDPEYLSKRFAQMKNLMSETDSKNSIPNQSILNKIGQILMEKVLRNRPLYEELLANSKGMEGLIQQFCAHRNSKCSEWKPICEYMREN